MLWYFWGHTTITTIWTFVKYVFCLMCALLMSMCHANGRYGMDSWFTPLLLVFFIENGMSEMQTIAKSEPMHFVMILRHRESGNEWETFNLIRQFTIIFIPPWNVQLVVLLLLNHHACTKIITWSSVERTISAYLFIHFWKRYLMFPFYVAFFHDAEGGGGLGGIPCNLKFCKLYNVAFFLG